MKERLLVLSRYSRLGASSRLRTMQYQPWLEAAGFKVEYAALFDDTYLQKLYAGTNAKSGFFKYYGSRFSQLKRKPKPNLIWLEYEALPWLPWLVERALLPASVPIVSDYDDAVFHRYDSHRLSLIRRLLGRKIDKIMRVSHLVTAGNPYLADRAHQAKAAHVEIVPTVVDLSHYSALARVKIDASVKVGWIGTPNTWDAFGENLFDLLEGTLSTHGACFRAVGAKLNAFSEGALDCVPWTEDSEVRAIQCMDVGVMPLTDTPWARGKCGYKLIQYMACGLPVVASPVGVNKEIVEHGVNGFLAETDAEWRMAIEMLLSDDDLRHRMGSAGRKKIEESYSLQIWGPRVAQMLRHVHNHHTR
ncbi:glycosyltransferase family 4 protein [Planktomarina temperata]|nr:glycosyltransferase family 4 protein [Planktomarina temperata]